MKKLAFFPLTLIIFLQINSVAQIRYHAGISTAMNTAFIMDKGLQTDPRYNANMTYRWAPAGLNFGVDIGKMFGISIEPMYTALGQKFDIVDVNKSIVGYREIDTKYIQVPLLFKWMSPGTGIARLNFKAGPQLALLQTGSDKLVYEGSFQEVPDGVPAPEFSADQGGGIYYVPPYNEIIAGTEDIEGALYDLNEMEIQLAAALGLTIDISRYLFLSTSFQAALSFTDMRGANLIDAIEAGLISEANNKRSNLAVGFNISINWMFGGTRHIAYRDNRIRRNYMIKQ